MPDYLVFGGRLRSPFAFPQFAEADASSDAAVDWALATTDDPLPSAALTPLGHERVNSSAEVRAYRSPDSLRLEFDDTGTFDVRSGGRSIVWRPGPDPRPENVREDVLGRVLAAAMHLAGRLCLHGSAVVLPGGGALAFLAPKHSGKSTLAIAAVERGARLLTDDTLPLAVGSAVEACPGVPGVRLWDDSLKRLDDPGRTYRSAGGKAVVTDLPAASLMRHPEPLKAVYLLAPQEPGDDVPDVRRMRISDIQSAVALVAHAKIGALLGKEEAPTMLDRAAGVAGRVPVYVLQPVRDLERLDAVLQQLFAWHVDDRTAPAGEAPGADS